MVRIALQASLTLFNLLAQLATAHSATHGADPFEDALNVLQRRQDSCPASNPVSCQAIDPKLPSNFCCQSNTTCYSLDSSSSALCCPVGKNCDGIQPIDCDVSLQDPARRNTAPVLTTRLNDTLSQCPGVNLCCPFGYACAKRNDGSPMCQIVANKAITQLPSTSSSSGSRGTNSAGSVPSNVSPASPSGIDSTKPQSSQSNNPFPPAVFLAGFFPGLLVGALGVLAWVILTGRHKKPDDNASITSSIYRKKPYISDPTPMGPQSARTDFLRKSTKSAMSKFSKRKSSEGTPGLPFDNWKMPTPPEHNNIPEYPAGRHIQAGPNARTAPETSASQTMNTVPVTPQRQIYGEQAGETIHVYTPRDMEYPSATVAPLRGMHSRDRSRGSAAGSPFVTPDRSATARTKPQPTHTPAYSYDSAYQTLTPARYEGGPIQKRSRPENAEQPSRPETTFTAMLEAINFPDPMNRQPPPVPRMPAVPNQYR